VSSLLLLGRCERSTGGSEFVWNLVVCAHSQQGERTPRRVGFELQQPENEVRPLPGK
jgi:hypothetical protein